MPHLILVKHAMPAIEPAVPASRWLLSEQGRADALALAEALAPYEPVQIVSSLEPKAEETARIVARRLGLDHATRPDLHEHDRREVGFLGDQAFQEAVAAFFRRPEELVMGAETAEAAGARFEAVVDAVVREAAHGTVVVVAHGTVISLYLARKAGMDPHELWKRLGLPSYVVLDLPALGAVRVVERLAGAM